MIDKIIEIIKSNSNFIVTSHTSPDGDAIGSKIAMFNILKKIGKNVKVIVDDVVPDRYRYLPDWENFILVSDLKENLDIEDYVMFVLDASNPDRIGKVKSLLENVKFVVNIDHHISNTKFGKYNWVDASAAAAAQMVYYIVENLGWNPETLPQNISKPILNGIYTDTGGFSYGNTDYKVFDIVSKLVRTGIRIDEISNYVYQNEPLYYTKLLGKLMYNIEIFLNGKVAIMTLTKSDLEEFGLTQLDTEHFVNRARSIKGVEVGIFIKEEKDFIRVSLRSKGKIDVNLVAQEFGGGGHKSASGFRRDDMSIEDIKIKLLEIIKVV